ncbi:Ankyrin repeat domain-containing protein 50, partial [Geodia barretti]
MSSLSPDVEGPEAAARNLCQKLTFMRGRTPSVSAIALNGDVKLVEKFLSETVGLEEELSSGDTDAIQLYIASFWGFPDVVGSLLDRGVNVNHANPGTLWTPLHAATFQEHGKVVMVLLERGANPDQKDSKGRTPKDFASASVKIWPHLAALGYSRSPKDDLIAKGIIKKVVISSSLGGRTHPEPIITRVVSGIHVTNLLLQNSRNCLFLHGI